MIILKLSFESINFDIKSSADNALLPNMQAVLICFHILVNQELRVLKESRIPLKPVLGVMRNVELSISSHEQTQ